MFQVLKENRPVPRALQDRIARAGGSNPLGEPNFRLVWGYDRLTYVHGLWEEWLPDGISPLRARLEGRWVPKYDPFDRYHVEKWMPPEHFGSPELWDVQTREWEGPLSYLALGPFPTRGEYEHCFTVQTVDKGYAPLTPTIVDWIVAKVYFCRALVHRDKAAARARLRGVLEAKDKAWRDRADAVVEDTWPAFGFRPHVAMGGHGPAENDFPSVKKQLPMPAREMRPGAGIYNP